jgi:hypothetical protein
MFTRKHSVCLSDIYHHEAHEMKVSDRLHLNSIEVLEEMCLFKEEYENHLQATSSILFIKMATFIERMNHSFTILEFGT